MHADGKAEGAELSLTENERLKGFFSYFSSTEMELSKKKTNRYNNYDEISGNNDEVIKC